MSDTRDWKQEAMGGVWGEKQREDDASVRAEEKATAPQEEENEGAVAVPSARGCPPAQECVHGYEMGQCPNAGCVAAGKALEGPKENEGDTGGPVVHSWVLDDIAARVGKALVARREAEAEDFGPEVGSFHPLKEIRSEEDVGGALALLALYQQEADTARRRMEVAIENARAWAAPRIAKMEDSAEALEKRILAYAKEHPELFGGTKTARFPAGSIAKTERKKDSWRLMEGAEHRRALVEWALKRDYPVGAPPLVLPGEPRPDVEAIKAYLEGREKVDPETGEAYTYDNPPGLEFVPAGTTISVKPAKRGGR